MEPIKPTRSTLEGRHQPQKLPLGGLREPNEESKEIVEVNNNDKFEYLLEGSLLIKICIKCPSHGLPVPSYPSGT